MKMKFQILFVAVLLIAGSTAVQAQRGGGHHHMNPEKKAEHMTAMLTEKLSLTEKQQAELKELNSAFVEKMKAQRENRSKEDMKALFEEQHAAISNLLTSEQKEKFEAMKADRKEGMGRHGRHFRGNPEEHKAMHEELRAYCQENILPVLLEQRAKLDSKISAADQKTIAGLREKLAAARKELAAEKEDAAAERPRHGHFKGGHKAMRNLMDNEDTRKQVEQLVTTYGADMDGLFAEISSKKEQWEKDRKAIHEKYRKDDSDAGGKKHWEGKEPDEKRMERKNFHHKVRFLLLEAGADAPTGQNQAERKITVYPNPATTSQNIEFEVLAAGKVQVEIVDPQGNVVKSVFKGDLPAGMNKLEVNTSGLTGRMYYYKVIDAQGMTTKPFFVK